MNPAEFCRDIEAYLCRKNEGHLIRIVGPVFDKVCGWAAQGVPLKVAHQGIDRYFDRRRAKGPSRRPVRVEFCEADILDAFDDWRRAVGVGRDMISGADGNGDVAAGSGVMAGEATVGYGAALESAEASHDASDRSGAAAGRRKAGLHTHIDRVMARLTQRRVETGVSSGLGDAIDRLLADLDSLRARAKGARQDARVEVVTRLRELDAQLIADARAAVDGETWIAAQREARDQLASFRDRMEKSAYDAALQAATARAFRDLVRLPVVSGDE